MPRKGNWSQDDMRCAIEECSFPNISKRDVARKYNIPWTTLQNKLSGKRPAKLEDFKETTVLTRAQEEEIVEWLKIMARRGLGRTKKDFLLTVKKYVDYHEIKTPWENNTPADMWYRLFRKRWPELVFRKTQKLGQARAQLTEAMLKQWFTNMSATLQDIDPSILLDPTRIFNADESGFQLDAHSGRVLTELEHKYVYQVSQETHTMITVLVCCNAAGAFIDPMLIYPPTQFGSFEKSEIFKDSFTTKSPNGWIDKSLFVKWLEKVFIPQTNGFKKPIVLFLDGHISHISLEASKLCRDNQIILYGLLAHASHIIQPLDVGIFKSLKASWREAVRQRTERVITKKSFAVTFKTAYESVTSNSVIVYQAFKKCGLFPLDYSAIDKSKLVSSATSSASIQPSTSDVVTSSSVPPTPISFDQEATSEGSSLQTKSLPPSIVQLMDFVVDMGRDTLDSYKTRFEEGYDVDDERYNTWKKIVQQCIVQQSQGDAREMSNPLTIPPILRGKRRQKKPMSNFMSGHEFIGELEDKELRKAEDAARREKWNKTKEERALKRKKNEEELQERKRKKLDEKSKKAETVTKRKQKKRCRGKPEDEVDEADDEERLKRAQEEAITKAKEISASLNEKDERGFQTEQTSLDTGRDSSSIEDGLDSILEEINSALMKEADTLVLD